MESAANERLRESHSEETNVSTMDFLSLFRSMWPYIRPYWATSLILLLGLLIESGFDALMRISSKYLIDEAIIPRNQRLMIIILGALGGGAVFSAASALGCDYLWARFGTKVMNLLREEIFVHLQKLSMTFYARSRTGDLMTRFTTDLDAVESALVYALPAGILAIGSLVLSAFFLFHIEWRLALITVAGLPFCFLAQKLFGKQAIEADVRYKQAEAGLSSVLQENLSAQAVVKAFGLQEKMISMFRVKLDLIFSTGVRSNFLTYLFQRMPNVTAELLSLVVIGIGAVLCFRGSMTVGSLMAFQILLAGMNASVAAFTWVIPLFISAAGGMTRIRQILDQQPLRESDELLIESSLDSDIEFQNVCFQYAKDRRGLENVKALLPRRSRVAFVGTSGSGKSTMMALLMRFYDPDKGSVNIGSRDIRSISLESLRKKIAVVFQENFLFNISLRENIRLGNLEATDEDIVEAARQAEIHDYIVSLPKGYDSPAGERGSRLSGGQRQRIAIARALVRKPQILLLDEATSALDPATEASINATLDRIGRGRTTISVTHRLASVVNVDQIFVFDQGHLLEQGIHDELVRKGGKYAQLWKKQNGFMTTSTNGNFKVDMVWLKSLPFFQEVAPSILENLAGMFINEHFTENRIVIYQGDPGDKFYIIVRGRVLATKKPKTSPEQQPVMLGDGDYFGEIALLKKVPRTATIRTLTDCVFLTLRQEQFFELMDHAPGLRAILEAKHLAEEDVLSARSFEMEERSDQLPC